jgi:hypothetical protein
MNVRLKVQSDGNMVVYRDDDQVLWAAGSSGSGSNLEMQGDGNLVLHGDSGVLWSTGSNHNTPKTQKAPPAGSFFIFYL